MKTQIKNASARITPALHARIATLAEARKRTPHAIMRKALESYVSREEKREAWRQEGIAAWEEYQETGLHLTNAEVKEWLLQLAAGDRVEPPQCHL